MTGLKMNCARSRDIAQVAYWAWLCAHPDAASRSKVPIWFVDASQGVDRQPWGRAPSAFNMQSMVYSFELDRVLNSEDL